mmetsp:Transcript_5804/g.6801  ORF Transcript_5804/g.6801 Transcript_5804/m.6801 type:complete len:195 (+) Transcript_5804:354-938(+)
MYSDYLAKVAIRKHHNGNLTLEDELMEVDNQNDELKQKTLNDYEMEETKEEKANSMKTGEKYIIRKLISFKINIPKIDEYINKVSALEIKQDKASCFPSKSSNVPVVDNSLMSYDNPAPVQSQANSMNSQFYTGMNPQNFNTGMPKSMNGFGDDSQMGYAQNLLFQQPNNTNMFLNFNNNYIQNMQVMPNMQMY